MMTRHHALIAAVLLAAAGCYHATIETGLPPSNRKIEQHWASAWVGGLVPPATVDTAERCPNGVARVETKQSFLNQLVGALTFGIYTPMYIEVTCARERPADADEVEVDTAASPEAKAEALRAAGQRAVETGRATYVSFR